MHVCKYLLCENSTIHVSGTSDLLCVKSFSGDASLPLYNSIWLRATASTCTKLQGCNDISAVTPRTCHRVRQSRQDRACHQALLALSGCACWCLKVPAPSPAGIKTSMGVTIFFTEEDILEITEKSRKETAHLKENKRFISRETHTKQ